MYSYVLTYIDPRKYLKPDLGQEESYDLKYSGSGRLLIGS